MTTKAGPGVVLVAGNVTVPVEARSGEATLRVGIAEPLEVRVAR